MEILILIAIFVILLKNSLQVVPPVHFAVSTFLGERNQTYSEGWHFTIPFLEKFTDDLLYSLKVDNIPISFTFPTKDNLQLKWEGIVEYVADPKVGSPYPRITDFSKDDLKKGLEQRTQDEVKKLGGSYEADAFKTTFSRALRHFIESIMRLEIPPHVNPEAEIKSRDDVDDETWNTLTEKLNNLIEQKKENNDPIDDFSQEVPVHHRLEFYLVFSGPIGNMLRGESEDPSVRSENEGYYGIDIQNISNSNIDYTGQMWEALEARKRSEKELEGKEEYHKRAMSMAEKIMEKSNDDLKFGEAYDKALTILDKANQKNFSFQGMSGKSGMILEVNNNE